MTVDLSAMGMFWFFTAGARSASSPRRIKEKFAFYPALNIEHRIDRTSSFITIVLGYSVSPSIEPQYHDLAPSTLLRNVQEALAKTYLKGSGNCKS